MATPEEPPATSDGEPPAIRDDATAALLLATFQDRYRIEVQADEDVFRTLPFFATSLGLVLAAVGFAATRLPPWSTAEARPVLVVGGGLIACSVLAAFAVLAFLWRATAPAVVSRPEREDKILADRARLLRDLAAQPGIEPEDADSRVAATLREDFILNYAIAALEQRALNRSRGKHRSRAAQLLIGSLVLAFAATAIIYLADKIGYLPRMVP